MRQPPLDDDSAGRSIARGLRSVRGTCGGRFPAGRGAKPLTGHAFRAPCGDHAGIGRGIAALPRVRTRLPRLKPPLSATFGGLWPARRVRGGGCAGDVQGSNGRNAGGHKHAMEPGLRSVGFRSVGSCPRRNARPLAAAASSAPAAMSLASKAPRSASRATISTSLILPSTSLRRARPRTRLRPRRRRPRTPRLRGSFVASRRAYPSPSIYRANEWWCRGPRPARAVVRGGCRRSART